MKIYFKLKAFPQVSETFIVSNLVYAKQQGFKIQIFLDRYLGLKNSSQAGLLKKYKIENDIVKPFRFSNNYIKKLIQIVWALSHFKILRYTYSYYKLKRKKNLSPLATLVQYKNFQNNIVHVHFNNALQPLVDLTKIGYIKPQCVITFHGYDAFINTKEVFQKKYGEFYEKHVVAVTTNSNYLKQQVLSLGVEHSKLKIVPIGINYNRFKGQPKQIVAGKTINLITVGRLVQLKGQIYAIRAMARLKENSYNINYTIIGSGQELTHLENEVKKHNLSNCINFLGAKSQDDIIQFLSQSDIFIMSSTYDNLSGRREAFGLVSVEAQAVGLPVVGFNSGGFTDTIIEEKTGYAVEDRNVEALSEKIKYLITHPNQYAKMSKAAINHASKFDHKKTTQQYLELYKTLTH